MLDPRIYRTGLVAVALAVVVLAFSLTSEQGGVRSNLAPDAFNGQNAYNQMLSLARLYPDRRPGSAGDNDVAEIVAQQLSRYGFSVDRSTAAGRTPDGSPTLETVVGTRAGQASGSILVVAPRDSASATSEPATLSGTAVLLDLARVLSGETQQRSVVLASISGSAGQAGALRLAEHMSGPVDAVIVLGDLASDSTRGPLVVPWSGGSQLAPTMLRNTLAGAVRAQAGLRPGGTSIAAQLAHLALPLSPGSQAPFNARGKPAVLLSLSGEHAPGATLTGSAHITAMGKALLQSITALDGARAVPEPAAYLLYSGKVVPAWAIRLLALGLILPVLLVAVDAAARAARRGDPPWLRLGWALGAAVPFALASAVCILARGAGLVHAPAGVLAGGIAPLKAGGVALLGGLGVLIGVGLFGWRRLWPQSGSPDAEPTAGPPSVILLLMCTVALAVWVGNPVAALLVVPALHLWPWALDPDLRLRRPLALLLLLAGLLAPAVVVVYQAHALGLGPAQALWHGLLLVAGGGVGLVTLLEWALLLGCVAGAAQLIASRRAPAIAEQPAVTVRGPVTYAGPGSLGGTESALRR